MNLTCDAVPSLLKSWQGKEVDSLLPQYSKNIQIPKTSLFLDTEFTPNMTDEQILSTCQSKDIFCKQYGGLHCEDCQDIVKIIQKNQSNMENEMVTSMDANCKLQSDYQTEDVTIQQTNKTKGDAIVSNAKVIKDTNTQITAQMTVLQENADKLDYLNQQLNANTAQLDKNNKKKFVGYVYANLGMEMSNEAYFYSLLAVDVSLAILFMYLLFKKRN